MTKITEEEKQKFAEELFNMCTIFITQTGTHLAGRQLALGVMLKDLNKENGWIQFKGWEYTWDSEIEWATPEEDEDLNEEEGTENKAHFRKTGKKEYQKVRLIQREDGTQGVDPETRTPLTLKELKAELQAGIEEKWIPKTVIKTPSTAP